MVSLKVKGVSGSLTNRKLQPRRASRLELVSDQVSAGRSFGLAYGNVLDRGFPAFSDLEPDEELLSRNRPLNAWIRPKLQLLGSIRSGDTWPELHDPVAIRVVGGPHNKDHHRVANGSRFDARKHAELTGRVMDAWRLQ